MLAANNRPTINDITSAELTPLVESAAQVDTVIADAWSSKQLVVMNSGNDLPVIDLREVGILCTACQFEGIVGAVRDMIWHLLGHTCTECSSHNHFVH